MFECAVKKKKSLLWRYKFRNFQHTDAIKMGGVTKELSVGEKRRGARLSPFFLQRKRSGEEAASTRETEKEQVRPEETVIAWKASEQRASRRQ